MFLSDVLLLINTIKVLMSTCKNFISFSIFWLLFCAGSIEQFVVVTPTLRHLWVEQQMQIVQDNFLDGLNFDYEHTMLPPEHHYRDAFTALIKETVSGLHSVQPYAQVSNR